MSIDVMDPFDEVYMKPQRYGYRTRSWLRNIVIAIKCPTYAYMALAFLLAQFSKLLLGISL
jgi:hypothetical protein